MSLSQYFALISQRGLLRGLYVAPDDQLSGACQKGRGCDAATLIATRAGSRIVDPQHKIRTDTLRTDIRNHQILVIQKLEIKREVIRCSASHKLGNAINCADSHSCDSFKTREI